MFNTSYDVSYNIKFKAQVLVECVLESLKGKLGMLKTVQGEKGALMVVLFAEIIEATKFGLGWFSRQAKNR